MKPTEVGRCPSTSTVACVEHCADTYPTGKDLHNNLHYKVKSKEKNKEKRRVDLLYTDV